MRCVWPRQAGGTVRTPCCRCRSSTGRRAVARPVHPAGRPPADRAVPLPAGADCAAERPSFSTSPSTAARRNSSPDQRFRRHADVAKHFRRRAADRRTDQHEIERSSQLQRLDDLAASGTPRSRRREEERHVAAKLGAEFREFRPIPAQLPQAIQAGQRRRRVARSARQTGGQRDAFPQTNRHALRQARRLLRQLDGATDQVVGAGREVGMIALKP